MMWGQCTYTAQGELVCNSMEPIAPSPPVKEGFVNLAMSEVSHKNKVMTGDKCQKDVCQKYGLTYIPDSWDPDTKTCGCDIPENEAYLKAPYMSLGGTTLDTILQTMAAPKADPEEMAEAFVYKCKRACHATLDCKGFVVDEGKTCWLKNSVKDAKPSTHTSYMRKNI